MIAFPRMTVPQILQRCSRLPVCPDLYTKLTTALQQPTQNICDLGKIISMDPVLTGKVLKTANSAGFGLSHTVRSVDDAIIRLGFEEIFSIAAAARAKDLFASNEQWESFGQSCWAHSLTTAVIARILARKVVKRRVEDAFFTAALLHDFGKLLLAQIDISYPVLCDYGAIFGEELYEREMVRYGASHAHVGGELMRRWNMPSMIVSAVEHHHQPVSETEPLDMSRLVVGAANILVHETQSAQQQGNEDAVPKLPPIIMERLSMSQDDIAVALTEAARQIGAMEFI